MHTPEFPAHGIDVDEDGNGSLKHGRLHRLVRQDGDIRDRTLEISFLDRGVEA